LKNRALKRNGVAGDGVLWWFVVVGDELVGDLWWWGGGGGCETWGETMCRESFSAQGGGCAGVWKVMGKWGLVT
jgi:hypothetical protein